MKILVSAYACEPNGGSEPGAGWNWAREIAGQHDVWVLTRANNRGKIEAHLAREPEPRMRFLYADLPRWASFWKRGQRGVRLYSYLWQFAGRRVAGRAHREVGFELVHHVTFANAFIPALTWQRQIPFVWGPVGGGVRVPWRLAPQGGAAALAYESIRSLRRLVGRYLDPLVRMSWRRADLILCQNRETLAWIPKRHRSKARLFPNAGIDRREIRPRVPRRDDGLLVVCAGRLIHLKAISLAIRAVRHADLPSLRLVLAGDGPDRRRLTRLAGRLGIQAQVDFRGWLSRDDLLELLAQADVLLFPSLHDECPLVVVEAMAHGVIPVALDLGGPRQLMDGAGFLQRARGVSRGEVVRSLAGCLRSVAAQGSLDVLREQAVQRAAMLEWSTKIQALQPLISVAGPPSLLRVAR